MAKHGLTHDDLMGVVVESSTYGVVNDRAVYRTGKAETSSRVTRMQNWQSGGMATPGGGLLRKRGRKFLYHSCKRGKSKEVFQETGLDFGYRSGLGGVNMAARPDFSRGPDVGYGASSQAYKMPGYFERCSSGRSARLLHHPETWRMRVLIPRHG